MQVLLVVSKVKNSLKFFINVAKEGEVDLFHSEQDTLDELQACLVEVIRNLLLKQSKEQLDDI